MKLLLAAGVCGAVILTVSSLSGLQEVSMNVSNHNQTAFAESTNSKTVYSLAVEAYQGLWGGCLHYFCSIKDNEVPGWKYQYTVNGTEDFSCTVWQNNYEENTYAMILSGTDRISDIKTYIPMMTEEVPSSQLQQTIKATKDMKNKVDKDIKKLYISGYSLGGYLSNYLAMELVDSANGYVNEVAKQYDVDISVKDIGDELTIDNVFCYSYAAPGLYAKEIKWLADRDVFPIPAWVKDKLARNENGDYSENIKNYKNNKDLVPNLTYIAEAVKTKVKFVSVGEVLTTDPPASVLEKNLLLKKVIQANMKVNISHLAYHAPDVYYGSIAKIEAQKQNVV